MRQPLLSRSFGRVFPGEEGLPGHAELYEDDGISQGYLRGEYRLTPVTYFRAGKTVSVEIAPAQRDFPGAPARRALIVELAQVSRADSVLIDGKAASVVEYDEKNRVHRVLVPETPASQGARIDFAWR